MLIRALEPLEGSKTMARLRGLPCEVQPKLLSSGPGRLCQALGITRANHNGLDVSDAGSPLQVLGFRPVSIVATPRIGISKTIDNRFASWLENKAATIQQTLNVRWLVGSKIISA